LAKRSLAKGGEQVRPSLLGRTFARLGCLKMNTAIQPADARGKPAQIRKWIPGLKVLRDYERAWLPRDLVAGLVLCTLLVPQGMAYAELAGLPAITGLYTTVVCLVAYAAFGPSPILVLGPDSALGPMIAAVVLPVAAGDVELAIALAGMLALLVGLINVGAGVAKLGFVADLISKPVRIGYLAGLAIAIFVGQLPKLFGFSVDADSLIKEAVAFLENLDQTNYWALGVGLLCLIIVLGLKRWRPRFLGILVAVVVAIGLSALLNLAEKGVSVIGVLPQGFPLPAFPSVPLSDLPLLTAAALGVALVAIGDTISVSAGFAARRGYDVDSNQELVGIGSANLLAGVFSGFPVSTSGSRTAVAEQSGAKTQLTGIAAAILVLVMLLFLPGLVKTMPRSVLAAVVIAASISLFESSALRHLWRVRKGELALAVVAILGVALVGVLEGIIIAVLLSILQFLERAWRPHYAVLGVVDDVPGYHDIQHYPGAEQIPGLLIIRWDAPLFFANADLFRKRVHELIARSRRKPSWVLVTAEPVTDVDTTAADMLVQLDLELNAAGIHLAFAELKRPVKEQIVRYSLLDTIDERHFYPTIEVAVAAFENRRAV
jgi:high affinity sulfate transporter 1